MEGTHLYRFPFRQVVIVGESQILGVLEVVVSDAVVIAKLVVFEELEAAVDHRLVSVCLECGTCQFEQDGERIRLVIVQF